MSSIKGLVFEILVARWQQRHRQLWNHESLDDKRVSFHVKLNMYLYILIFEQSRFRSMRIKIYKLRNHTGSLSITRQSFWNSRSMTGSSHSHCTYCGDANFGRFVAKKADRFLSCFLMHENNTYVFFTLTRIYNKNQTESCKGAFT